MRKYLIDRTVPVDSVARLHDVIDPATAEVTQ